MRIFHGISGAAGQPSTISKAQRALGFDAYCYGIEENKFGYNVDFNLEVGGDFHSSMFKLLEQDLYQYDVFHFYFRSLFFNKKTLAFPTGLDLLLLKAAGKKIFINFRGSEARIHSMFKEYSPYNYVDENPAGLTENFPEEAQRRYIEFALAIADGVLVPDAELQSYIPGSIIIPRAIELERFDPNSTVKNIVPVVLHAPSRRVVKGTDYVLRALEELKEEGVKFELRLIEGLENEEAVAEYAKADIIVDQLRIGWYGVLAVEAMAMRKPVVSYIREDLVHTFSGGLPVANANPENIKGILRELIENSLYREEIARRGYEYCCATHDSKKVASALINVYQTSSKIGFDEFQKIVRFVHKQHEISNSARRKLKKYISKRSPSISSIPKHGRYLMLKRIVKRTLVRIGVI